MPGLSPRRACSCIEASSDASAQHAASTISSFAGILLIQVLENGENVPPNGQIRPPGAEAQATAEGTPSKARRCASLGNTTGKLCVSWLMRVLRSLW